jgi:hypothetical protein
MAEKNKVLLQSSFPPIRSFALSADQAHIHSLTVDRRAVGSCFWPRHEGKFLTPPLDRLNPSEGISLLLSMGLDYVPSQLIMGRYLKKVRRAGMTYSKARVYLEKITYARRLLETNLIGIRTRFFRDNLEDCLPYFVQNGEWCFVQSKRLPTKVVSSSEALDAEL